MGERPDVPAFASREIPLPSGGLLVVRPVTSADVDGLAALYDNLSDDDCFRRFFSVSPPDRAFLEDAVRTVERDGFGLVAVAGDGGERVIVGEATYAPLPDGDAEFGITVDRRWRGWLGPYLLDALLAAAAARGVPNLQADVLVRNRRMMELAAARGYATMDHPDWTVVRIVVGTSGTTPRWPRRDGRPRVLVEVPGGRWHAEEAAREAGLRVVACPGPVRGGVGCPVLEGEPCPLAAGADAIVVSRPPGGAEWRALLGAHATLHPGIPLCIESEPAAGGEAEGLALAAPWPPPEWGGSAVVGLVARLAEAHARAAPADLDAGAAT